jgi:hypothetical protein
MNERIQELIKQAVSFRLDPDSECYEALIHPEDLELFAELIVRECAEQSMSIGRYNTPSGVTPDLSIAIAVGLKKHFGVEE